MDWCRQTPVTGEFPAQRASNAKDVSILWRHHAYWNLKMVIFLITIYHFYFLPDNPAHWRRWILPAFHDDVIKWKHFPRYWPFVRGIHRSPVNSPHKGQWRGALMFSLTCVWINAWVNNGESGDLRRYRAHYDVIVMQYIYPSIRSATHWQAYVGHYRIWMYSAYNGSILSGDIVQIAQLDIFIYNLGLEIKRKWPPFWGWYFHTHVLVWNRSITIKITMTFVPN